VVTNCYLRTIMDVHQELSAKFRGRRYLTPEGRLITVSHVNQIDGSAGSYFTAHYNADEPDGNNSTRAGSCRLDFLECLAEII